ncbi:uncharacterized protein LOC129794427 [Lutzomyia longipalpis]|uniref:uncharacterized protein LOC129794427 n=1 Tax=Lutzomyia longipalpis TaxID=7200 RepID=UPI0024834FB7|nr:uncharacterized protein LOC129794427 [Lutzomyia longipalpis]
MWQHRKIILISLILILSLVSMCLKKRNLRHGSEKENLTEIMERSRILKDNLCVDMEANRTNFFYIFCLRRAPFWDSDANGANSISAHGNKIASVIGDKGSGNIQSGRGTLGERRKVKGTEDENNVNSANPVIISCILWLLLSLGKACFEMTNDLKERKKSTSNGNVSRRLSLQNFTFARNERKSFGTSKLYRRSTIESIQPTSFATNYELMRANEAHRILSMSSFPTTPVLDRRCSVPVNVIKQLPRQSSLGCQTLLQRQFSGDSGSPGGADRSPEVSWIWRRSKELNCPAHCHPHSQKSVWSEHLIYQSTHSEVITAPI